MEELTLEHPDLARLAAFGQGALDHGEMTEVETHLAVCESCCELLSALPDDEFVDRLRASQKLPGWSTAFCGYASAAATAHVDPDATGFEVPSSFVFSDPNSGSGVPLTAGTGGRSGSSPREFPLEQELPSELLNHPRYRIVRKLGAGGMGSVYLAQHRMMDRPVALKVIRSDLLGKPALVERFRREVKSAAHLALHPNIVAAYDAEQAGESHFLVMEFVDGINLGDLVKSQGPLSVESACDAIKQAAEGLEHAHQRGMVHRDIKPQNLMRTPDGQIKILDFGLARLASEVLPDLAAAEEDEQKHLRSVTPAGGFKLTLTDMVLGSADYIAPEQALDPRSADIRADIYSLGCTLYHLLAGEPPFPEGNLTQKLAAHAQRAPKSLSDLRPDVSPKLVQIVDRMMAKDRDRRLQRPAEVAEALVRFGETRSEQHRLPDEAREHYQEAFSCLEVEALSVQAPDIGVTPTREPLKVASRAAQLGTQNAPLPWPTRLPTAWRKRPLVTAATVLAPLIAVAGIVTLPFLFIRRGNTVVTTESPVSSPTLRAEVAASGPPHSSIRRPALAPDSNRGALAFGSVARPTPVVEFSKAEILAKVQAFWDQPFLKKTWDIDQVARSPETEMNLGRELHNVIVALNPTLQDSFLRRVEETADPLLKTVSRKDIRYTFTILDSHGVNAFSQPGGYIYVSRGLFDMVGEDEYYALEFVLGHEIAHVELKHAIQCLQDSGVKKLPWGTLQKLYGLIIPAAFLDEQEYEADAWIFRRMRAMGRTNRERFAFLRKLEGYAKTHEFENGRAKPGPNSSFVDNHLPAHTAPYKRLKRLEAIRDQASAPPK